MKTQLTAEQSANLISKGVCAEMASEIYIEDWKSDNIGIYADNAKPIFTLSDLLLLLPKTIYYQNYYLDLSCEGTNWTASYILWDDCDYGTYIRHTQGEKTADELIDALYELALYCADNNYLNKE